MSYVLEALRRAEAERQRGHVPGLHAQTLPAPEAVDAGPGRAPARWGPWTAGALGLVGLGLAALWWTGWWAETGPTALERASTVEPAQASPAVPAVVVVPPPVRPPPVPRARAAEADRPPAAGDTAASQKVVRFEQLPDALRRQIPALAFGGATHSPEPSARMLLINGQVWREGDEPAPGLRLERIELRAAQFRFQDRRFELAY